MELLHGSKTVFCWLTRVLVLGFAVLKFLLAEGIIGPQFVLLIVVLQLLVLLLLQVRLFVICVVLVNVFTPSALLLLAVMKGE